MKLIVAIRKTILIVLPLGPALLIGACASDPSTLGAYNVPSSRYSGRSCDQIATEAGSVGRRFAALHKTLEDKHLEDVGAATVGLFLFWPTLLLLEGEDKSDATEYSYLKGEYEALRIASLNKGCDLSIPSAESVIKGLG